MTDQRPLSRRSLLRLGLAATAFQTAGAFRSLAAAGGGPTRLCAEYGPLVPAVDETTGLTLLRLPRGFRYRSFAWTGDALSGGGISPDRPDGMGVVAVDARGLAVLARNHEIAGAGTPLLPARRSYDPGATGGVTRLAFDLVSGTWRGGELALSGTSFNCAGGVTPWSAWLSCEETTAGPGSGLQRPHGYVFEVPAVGDPSLVPLTGLGRFRHEAACVAPDGRAVYLTEDDTGHSGFYRFTPRARPGSRALESGGELAMLAVAGSTNRDLARIAPGSVLPVEWVPIDVPDAPPVNGPPFGTVSGPFWQGHMNGAARFRRLEGAWFDTHKGVVYFADTEGAGPVPAPRCGVIWRYDPRAELLSAVYVTPSAAVLDNPDNVTVSPRGWLLVCEDGSLGPRRMHAISPAGEIVPFAENAVVLSGEVNGITGDFRAREWCGACFDPTGTWLFANLQAPGITFAITGPWENGPL